MCSFFLIPAVSTKRQVFPAISTCSSIGSRVVPANSFTTARLVPVALFSNELLPTFGRPMSATRLGPEYSASATSDFSGSIFRAASSRSATPRPWRAETGKGSPSPSDHKLAASGSRCRSSILLATKITGLPLARNI